jgi:hypothetical protein
VAATVVGGVGERRGQLDRRGRRGRDGRRGRGDGGQPAHRDDQLGRRRSPLRCLVDTGDDGAPEVVRDAGMAGRSLLGVPLEDGSRSGAGVGRPAHDELVEHHPERVDVGRRCRPPAVDHLRREVVGGADEGAGGGEGRRVEHPGDAEVGQPDVA